MDLSQSTASVTQRTWSSCWGEVWPVFGCLTGLCRVSCLVSRVVALKGRVILCT
ncbi:hypothetical protein E2C01_087819 [Portunus trituberculatus]|uniref:Uncharacterized protein n=1 Tax=Portunus trituberculatus TaxID=210409 RepID=A0A5B7JED3_PORTR|nr:hypothetical protein [Portunus trituberculatus]